MAIYNGARNSHRVRTLVTRKPLRLHLIRSSALIVGVLLLTTILIIGGPVRADEEDSRPRFNGPGNIVEVTDNDLVVSEYLTNTETTALFGEAESPCRRIV